MKITLEVYQILVPIISLVFILYAFKQFNDLKNTLFETLFWTIFWFFIIIIAIFPEQTTEFLANLFGIKSNVNAIIFFGLGILFFFQFQMYFGLKKQNNTITSLVRKIALLEQKLKNKKK